MTATVKLVLVRHGESQMTAEGRFAGWSDVGVSEKGITQAEAAADMIRELQLKQHWKLLHVYSSVLQRSIESTYIILRKLDSLWLPHDKCWRLNERHYGTLEGRNKKECSQEYGEAVVASYRRGYDVCPPKVGRDDPRWPGNSATVDYKALGLGPDELPCAESPAECEARVTKCWRELIQPKLLQLASGASSAPGVTPAALVLAHGTSLRALIREVEGWSTEEAMEYEVPSGIPIVYTFSVRSDCGASGEKPLCKIDKHIPIDESDLRKLQQKITAQSKI